MGVIKEGVITEAGSIIRTLTVLMHPKARTGAVQLKQLAFD